MINTWSNMKTYKFHFSDVNVCHFYAFGIWWIPPPPPPILSIYSRRYNNHGWPGITSRKNAHKNNNWFSISPERQRTREKIYVSVPSTAGVLNCFLSLQRHYTECVCVCACACVCVCVCVCVRLHTTGTDMQLYYVLTWFHIDTGFLSWGI